ncbi:MAG: phosphodiester glycosidase family protein [Propionibacteriaceae bacterium]|jgi:exopolysaccharide biosynthesis protein|nr:phosphodiester glycosidase family protein [Propionibacteriaceae bacterium]
MTERDSSVSRVTGGNRAQRRFAWVFAVVATLFTAFVLLEAFVIPRSGGGAIEVPVFTPPPLPSETPTPTSTPEPWPPPPPLGMQRTSPVRVFVDDTRKIAVSTYHIFDSDVYVADIKLSDVAELKTAFASDTYGRNITQRPSTMARNTGAIVAINGDYYGARSAGYVIRNGELYRDRAAGSSQEDMIIWWNGSSSIVHERDVNAAGLMANGARQGWSFGPALIENGEVVLGRGQLPYHTDQTNPRTAIAEVEPLHYLLVVVDGRTRNSKGLTLSQFANVLAKFEVNNAYNLDGGGTTTMLWHGEVINRPVGDGATGTVQERWTSDIVYV